MNQTSTAAAIATVIGAYTGLIAMVGFLMYATRSSVINRPPRRRPETPPTATGRVVSPRRAADDIVRIG